MSNDLTPLQRSAQDNIKIVTAAVYAAIIVIGALLLLPEYWYLWLIIMAIGVWRIMVLMTPKPAYMCEKCGKIFQWKKSTTLRPKPSDLYADNKTVRCPKCGSTTVHKLKKDEI